jgi:thermostable 8-oxoguanine DNA glycosylase
MEPHKNINISEIDIPLLELGAKDYFIKAHKFAYLYYHDVIEKISSTKFNQLSVEHFFQEYTWVVYTSGFSAKAVSRFFSKLTDIYGDYLSLSEKTLENIMSSVKLVCNNKQKAGSIMKMAKLMKNNIDKHGWEKYRDECLSSPELLTNLPYIGKITCYHLARNIGLLDSVKPDLHLVRAAKYWGYNDCEEMCRDVQPEGTPLGIVDLILWYSLSSFGTKEID